LTHYIVQHIGLDINFHHPRGSGLKLADEVVELYESDKEHAEIFTQVSSGTTFSQVEILSWFLLQTRTEIQDHLPMESRQKQNGDVFMTFPIRFKPGTFHMPTEDGNVDLSQLKLMCKITISDRDG